MADEPGKQPGADLGYDQPIYLEKGKDRMQRDDTPQGPMNIPAPSGTPDKGDRSA